MSRLDLRHVEQVVDQVQQGNHSPPPLVMTSHCYRTTIRAISDLGEIQ
jgi:hypothetical protein